MGTNPIGLALRDAGQAFGSLLEQEARRRDQALSREVSLGELALRGTQAAQQGRIAEFRRQRGLGSFWGERECRTRKSGT